jgi:hypothetical protein
MSENTSPVVNGEQVEAAVRRRLGRRVCELRVVIQGGAVILRGQAFTYYAKQLAQHVIMEEIKLPIQANEIEVRSAAHGAACQQLGEPT